MADTSFIKDLTSTPHIEGSTPQIGFTFKGEAGDTYTGAFVSINATITDIQSGTKLTGWDAEDVSGGAHGFAVASGVVTWDMPATATAKVGTDPYEDHIILIHAVFNTDRVLKYKLKVRVHEDAEV